MINVFLWAILSCLFPAVRNPDRLPHKKYENNLDDKGLVYPVDVNNIQKFKDKNTLIINVFGWENNLLSIYHTDNKIYKLENPYGNLLLYISYYVWIINNNALMYDQTKGQHKNIHA